MRASGDRGRRFAWLWFAKPKPSDNADAAQDDAEYDERHRRAGRGEHGGYGKCREHSAHSVPCGNDTDRESTPVWKPSRHQTDDADVDDPGPDSAEKSIGQEQHPHIVDVSRDDPSEPCQGCADGDQRLGPEPINEPPLGGREQRLQDDQHRERDLHGGQGGAGRGLKRLDEQGPNVLRARDGHHDDETKQKLDPSRRRGG